MAFMVWRELPQLGAVLTKLIGDTAAGKWAMGVGAAVVAYFLPTEAQQMAALGACHLVVLDTVTGVVAARTSGRAISSARLGRALVKLLAYGSVISVVAVAAKHIPGGQAAEAPSITSVLGLIIATEGISVLENVRAMGVSLPFGLDGWLVGRASGDKPE